MSICVPDHWKKCQLIFILSHNEPGEVGQNCYVLKNMYTETVFYVFLKYNNSLDLLLQLHIWDLRELYAP